MANFKGHIVGGLIAGGAVTAVSYAVRLGEMPDGGVLLSDWQLLVGAFVLATLFGLWPDVDTNSKAQDFFFGLAFITDILLVINEQYIPAALLGLLAMTPIVGTHRGWTHTKLAAIFVPLPILIIPYLAADRVGETALLLYASSVAGYFSHLLFDGLIFKWFRIKGGW